MYVSYLFSSYICTYVVTTAKSKNTVAHVATDVYTQSTFSYSKAYLSGSLMDQNFEFFMQLVA